jgi:hypothetical protein
VIGRRPARDDLLTSCPQCDRPDADVLALTARRVRYSCQCCGAVITVATRARLRPRGRITTADPLTLFMPVRMVRWLRWRYPDAEPAYEPDKATLIRWYGEFDGFVRKARNSADLRADHAEITRVPLDPRSAALPKFSRVLTVLSATCYDVDVAMGPLVPAAAETEYAAMVRERICHALAWYSATGRADAWITAPDGLTDADPAVVGALLEPDALASDLSGARLRAFFAALFGVPQGPSPRHVVAQFSAERVQAALRSYLDDGSRPLREVVLNHLAGTV